MFAEQLRQETEGENSNPLTKNHDIRITLMLNLNGLEEYFEMVLIQTLYVDLKELDRLVNELVQVQWNEKLKLIEERSRVLTYMEEAIKGKFKPD